MGWAALIHHTVWEDAYKIASQYELACVSCRQFERQRGEYPIQPIVTRRKIGKYWYNYFEDGQYRRTLVRNRDGTIPHTYAPYFYVPDKVRFIDLLSYLNKYFGGFKGIYHTYLLYYTKDYEEVIYSVYLGILHMPLHIQFDNALLFFQTGKPHTLSHLSSRRNDLE